MPVDIVAQLGPLMLGSRLKRLGERLQADTARFIEQCGLDVQPSQYPILVLLDRNGAMSVNELVEATGVSQPGVTRNLANLVSAGLVDTNKGMRDQRQRMIALTAKGAVLVERSKCEVWPFIRAAAANISRDMSGSFLDMVGEVEARLADKPLDVRASDLRFKGLHILPYSDELAACFRDINVEWIESMYKLEPTDIDVLENARERIIDKGGDIMFVAVDGLGVVGTCALQKTGPDQYELTKMGVLERARGRKAGEFLLHAVIDRAMWRGAKRLYLLTNKRSQSAIHLYEKLGFEHDEGIMRDFGSRYERCDVAMLYNAGYRL